MTASRNRRAFTRGKPFAQGNPGKPKGARHRTTIVAEKLMGEECDAIVQTVIEKAKGGDMVAAKIVLDRIVPIRKGAVVELDLPEVTTSKGVAAALAALVHAMASGDVTPDEASTISSVLEIRRRAIETQEIDERLKKLEDARNGDQSSVAETARIPRAEISPYIALPHPRRNAKGHDEFRRPFRGNVVEARATRCVCGPWRVRRLRERRLASLRGGQSATHDRLAGAAASSPPAQAPSARSRSRRHS